MERPWCHHTALPGDFPSYRSLVELARTPNLFPVQKDVTQQQGELHEVAARILMRVLWAARLCRRACYAQ